MPGPSAMGCPWCKADPGALFVSTVVLMQPLGSFSLSGMQIKAPASHRPCLVCRVCRNVLVGEWEEARHPVFDPREAPEQRTAEQVAALEERALEE